MIIRTSEIIVSHLPFTPIPINIFCLPDGGRSQRAVDDPPLLTEIPKESCKSFSH